MIKKILYTKPSITDLEINYALDAAKNGWGEKCYEYIKLFENAFKDHLSVKYALATSSCTGALHMGLHALNIGIGDEVILANTNWVASAAPIVHLGATPIFVDILKDTWCLDPNQVEKAITKNTKAIIAVHLYGNLCDMDRLIKISNKYDIPLVEDAAEAIGSKYKGKAAGSIGSFGTFSFHGTKTITTGEGGMFVTNNENLFNKVLTLSNHGRSQNEKKQFWIEQVGFKYKMSNIEAAIGFGQISRVKKLIKMKRDIFEKYYSLLKDYPLIMNPEFTNTINGYWMPTFVAEQNSNFNRDLCINKLKKIGADARVFFWPLSQQIPQGKKAFDTEYISEKINLRALNLPSPFGISEKEIISICEVVKSCF